MRTPEIVSVPIEEVIAEQQVRTRFDEEAIKQLADSIESCGLQQPILCRRSGDRLIVIDGERRLRACRLLGWAEIPVLITTDDPDESEIATRQLVCNLQREDLNPTERALGIRALMEKGPLTTEQAARALGLSPAAISKSLALLKLPPPLLEQVTQGTIPPDAGYQLSRVTDPNEQAQLAQQVVDKEISRDGLARKLKPAPRRTTTPTRNKLQRVVLAVDEASSITVAASNLNLDRAIECLEQMLKRVRRSKADGITLETFARTLRDKAVAKEPA